MEIFRKSTILPFHSQYTFSLYTPVINNCDFFFKSISVIYEINTRHENNLHLPHASLSVYPTICIIFWYMSWGRYRKEGEHVFFRH
jgi:hypothetical protein